nr:hypothetical protein GCM10017547_09790 [Pseudarthrobacter oxydans]
MSRETYLDLEALASLIEAGSVKPAVDKVFPLAEAPAAVRYLGRAGASGKWWSGSDPAVLPSREKSGSNSEFGSLPAHLRTP